jgi:hypothetical protein
MAKLEKIPSKATARAKSITKKQNEPDKIKKMKARLKAKKEKKYKNLSEEGLKEGLKPKSKPKKKAGTVSCKK